MRANDFQINFGLIIYKQESSFYRRGAAASIRGRQAVKVRAIEKRLSHSSALYELLLLLLLFLGCVVSFGVLSILLWLKAFRITRRPHHQRLLSTVCLSCPSPRNCIIITSLWGNSQPASQSVTVDGGLQQPAVEGLEGKEETGE